MRRIISRRVLVLAALFALEVGWIQLFEPEPVQPTNLLQTIPAAVSEVFVQAGGHQAVYRAAKDSFVLAGPPAALADELKNGVEADKNAEGPSFGDLVGGKRPSLWRARRFSDLLVQALRAVRGGGVVQLPAPDAKDRAAYGVERGDVVLKLNAGKEYEIRVGSVVPGGRARYFHCPQEKIWGLLPGDLVGRLERLATRELPEDSR